MTRSLLGAPVADGLYAACRARIERGRRPGRPPPLLASVHQGRPTPFAVYLRQQARGADRAGVGFRAVTFDPDRGATAVREVVGPLNDDPTVHAVLLEHPLPDALDFAAAIGGVRFEKDVDGVGPVNLGRLVSGATGHAPAVARAALAVAAHYGVPLRGQRVAVVGRSPTVGLPLALLLAARGPAGDATVTLAHRATPDLAAALHGASVIFSCAGQPGLLTRKVVPEGAVVIDVGLSTVADATAPRGQRVVGDADLADLDGWVEALTPVPGGIGPVTVAQLMSSVVDAWDWLGGGDPR